MSKGSTSYSILKICLILSVLPSKSDASAQRNAWSEEKKKSKFDSISFSVKQPYSWATYSTLEQFLQWHANNSQCICIYHFVVHHKRVYCLETLIRKDPPKITGSMWSTDQYVSACTKATHKQSTQKGCEKRRTVHLVEIQIKSAQSDIYHQIYIWVTCVTSTVWIHFL